MSAKGNSHSLYSPGHYRYIKCNLPYSFTSMLPKQARKLQQTKHTMSSVKGARVTVWTGQKPGAGHVWGKHLEMKHPPNKLDTANISLTIYSAPLWTEGHSAPPSHVWTWQWHAVKAGPKGKSINWRCSGKARCTTGELLIHLILLPQYLLSRFQCQI